jgi:hypothetical protein
MSDVSPRALSGLAASLVGAVLLVSAASAQAATGRHTVTVYSVATKAQFLNHQDDRQRAIGKNPFLADTKKLTPTNTGKGPFAGDSTLYAFDLYTSPTRTKKVGTAAYDCYYNFARHALCYLTFDVNGSTLIATGQVNFKTTQFKLPVTGGTVQYKGANGEVAMKAMSTTTQRLVFTLLD